MTELPCVLNRVYIFCYYAYKYIYVLILNTLIQTEYSNIMSEWIWFFIYCHVTKINQSDLQDFTVGLIFVRAWIYKMD